MPKEIALIRATRDNHVTIDVRGETRDILTVVCIALVDIEMKLAAESQAEFRADFMELLNHVRNIRVKEGKFD